MMLWILGFVSGIAATVTFAAIMSRVLLKRDFARNHQENMDLLRAGHEIMRENGLAISRIAAAIASVSSQQADLDMILLPRAITAENGAKGLLIGEFAESIEVQCPNCDGQYYYPDGSHCGVCNDGFIPRGVPVSWPTIKAIYAKIVEHYGAKT